MSTNSEESAKILARLDSIERSSNAPAWAAVAVAFVAAIGSIVTGLVLADRTVESSRQQADATRSSTEATVAGERAAFVASQRRDSYATLGRTVRDQIRILQLARNRLADEGLPGNARPVNAVVGTAYRTTRGVAVDTELVGDDMAGQMARCLVAGFLDIGKDLEALRAEAVAGVASTDGLESAQNELLEMQEYEVRFIRYGADNLFPDEATVPHAGGKDPDCRWPRQD